MSRLSRLILLASFALSAGCSTVTGWFSDDDFDPREPVELQKISEQVKLKSRWSRGVGDGQGDGLYKMNPILVDDSLYVASAEGRVAAVDAETGRVRWKNDLDLALSGGSGTSPRCDFRRVLRRAGDATVRRKRRRNLAHGVSGEVLSAPQGDGRYVVAQTYDGKLMGFDYETGEVRWTYTSDVPVLTLRGTGTPMILGDNAIAGFADGKVVAINLRSGNVAWEARVASRRVAPRLSALSILTAPWRYRAVSSMSRVIRADWLRLILAQVGGYGSEMYLRYQAWAWALATSILRMTTARSARFCEMGRECVGRILIWDSASYRGRPR